MVLSSENGHPYDQIFDENRFTPYFNLIER